MSKFPTALKKGELGEKIIIGFLEEKGWIIYSPIKKDRAHYFDMLATKDKKMAIAIDVKTKARLNNWPAQGINIKSYQEYMNFTKKINIPFYLIFIDDKTGDVHCVNLKELKKGFKVNDKIIAWNLSNMRLLFNIGKENIILLSKYDQRNYEFKPKEESP